MTANDTVNLVYNTATVSAPTHGTVTLTSSGSYTYTPAANFHGTDSFTYRLSDGQLQSQAATVQLTITPVNDAPVATDGTLATLAPDSLQNPLAGLLGWPGAPLPVLPTSVVFQVSL